jgi:predicted RNase H-like HicB family nuclease
MKKYAIIVYWSHEDAVWIAEAPDLEPFAAHGSTPEQAVAELRVAMDLGWRSLGRRVNLFPTPAINRILRLPSRLRR